MRRREFCQVDIEGIPKTTKKKTGDKKKSESSFWFAEIYEVQSPMTGFQKIKSAKKYNIEKAK